MYVPSGVYIAGLWKGFNSDFMKHNKLLYRYLTPDHHLQIVFMSPVCNSYSIMMFEVNILKAWMELSWQRFCM